MAKRRKIKVSGFKRTVKRKSKAARKRKGSSTKRVTVKPHRRRKAKKRR